MSSASLRDLFESGLGLAADAREAWLRANCPDAEQQSMLRRMWAADAASAQAVTIDAADLAQHIGTTPHAALGPGASVGSFRLIEALGEGGFARVFRAERASAGVRQEVALKLLNRSLNDAASQRLFRRERLALSQLQHPNIARLIEGGVTDGGVGFIALELVDGVPITAFAQSRQLDPRARLRLFLQVCQAVAAAHRALIVHRDLKPSNVLVTREGEVKLLDFGIAKLLAAAEDEEHTQMPAFTPAYAAPEQQRNDAVTTATDVYSLGVLLGELLTGRRLGPGDGRTPSMPNGGTAIDAAVADVRRLLRGDLERIVAKALAKDPEVRYASAGALADDIGRYLDGQPVWAHPPSLTYRLGKFVRRHRVGVTFAAVMGMAIVASLAIALWQTRMARQEAVRANTVRDFLLDVFDAARAHAPRDTRPTPEALVERARQRLANSTLDPQTRIEILQTLGRVDLSLARFAEAQAAFDEALALAKTRSDADLPRQLRLLKAEALQRAGNTADARALVEQELPALRARGGEPLIHALGLLGDIAFASGEVDTALARFAEAVQIARTLDGDDGILSLTAQFRHGSALAEAQRYPDAVATLEPLLARWRATHAPEDDRYVAALGSLAAANDALGDTAGSEARLREVLALKRRIYPEPHHRIAASLREVAQIVGRDGTRADEAEALFREALAMQHAVYGEIHPDIAETLESRGLVLVAQRRIPEAQAAYREALAICERAALKAEVCPRSRNNLGMSLYRDGQLDEAERQMRLALDERRALYGGDHPTIAFSLSTLANVAAARGDGADAVELASESVAMLDRLGRGASREGALVRYTLASALWRDDRFAEALPVMERTLDDWARVAPDGGARRVSMLVQKAQILDGLGRPEAARQAAEEAIALGVPAQVLQPLTRDLLRRYSGRSDVYPESAVPP